MAAGADYPPKVYGWHAIDNDDDGVDQGLGGLRSARWCCSRSWFLRGARQEAAALACDAALALSACSAFASWWNLGHFHFDHYIHIWEHYHYYMGAKYGPELRYARLYECTAAADVQDGLRARVKSARCATWR